MIGLEGDLLWPIAGASVAGALIGIEREYRSSPAGFRTHILVCLSSALLMLSAVHQVRWLTDTPLEIIRIDPVRMAHGVLTGIGFLCGGVIFREGFNIRGLTTAASLWMTSALGILFGVGFYGLALSGTAATVVVLAAITVTEHFLPQRQFARIKVRYRRGAHADAGQLRTALTEQGLKFGAISQSAGPEVLEFCTTITWGGDAKAERFAEALTADPRVTGFDVLPHDD